MLRVPKRVALDIDGVVLKGGRVIEGASASVKRLIDNQIPFIFMTNGGGVSEREKASELSSKLSIPILEEQILLSHTPLRCLDETIKKSQVLVLGRESCLDVAEQYGFKRVLSSSCILKSSPLSFPIPRQLSLRKVQYDPKERFGAVLIFHDPVDWALDMQIASDILSQTTDREAVPLFGCNADLAYSTEYHLPRFTQGAFLASFRHLYEAYHNTPLNYTLFGKPYRIQYDFAEKMLQSEARRIGDDCPNDAENAVFFGIGDNPLSDIRGANAAGPSWKSILVRTGMFQGVANDPLDPADVVLQDLTQAVDYIIRAGTNCFSGSSC